MTLGMLVALPYLLHPTCQNLSRCAYCDSNALELYPIEVHQSSFGMQGFELDIRRRGVAHGCFRSYWATPGAYSRSLVPVRQVTGGRHHATNSGT
ncbi:hypothetical protein BD414DRAFT_297386 [Trametes punicea]|nr:hypothetical protein BD414DRAFT_297386 [Trametes punicea]